MRMSNKSTVKQEKHHKWTKNHNEKEFYLSPKKSTVVDGSFMTYLLFYRGRFVLEKIELRDKDAGRLTKPLKKKRPVIKRGAQVNFMIRVKLITNLHFAVLPRLGFL